MNQLYHLAGFFVKELNRFWKLSFCICIIVICLYFDDHENLNAIPRNYVNCVFADAIIPDTEYMRSILEEDDYFSFGVFFLLRWKCMTLM